MQNIDVFNTLNAINVNEHTEKKNGLTYLSWAWAWGEVKKRYPDAFYTIYENAEGWFYHTDGATCWVKTGVTINGLELIEYLPVMDFKNKSIPVGNVTSFDVNKAIQRSLTKAIARHGLGLYIYAGEDLPEDDPDAQKKPKAEEKPPTNPPKRGAATNAKLGEEFGMEIAAAFIENGIKPDFVCKLYGVKNVAEMTEKQMEHAMANMKEIKKRQEEGGKS